MWTHLLILLVWTSLCLLTELIVFTAFIYAFKAEFARKRRRMSRFVAVTNIMCLFCYIFCSVGDLAHFGYSFHFDYSIFDYEHDDLIVIIQVADTFYFTASLSIYILFLGRVVITFRKSEYEMSKLTLLLFSGLFLFALYNMVFYIFYIGKDFEIERNYIIALMCLEVAISASLTFLFIFKLRQLTINRTSMSLNERTFDDSESIQLDDHSLKMIHVLTRYAILSIMAIVVGLFFYSVELYQIFLMEIPTNTSFAVMYGLREFEVVVCMISLYLSFVSTKSRYDRVCKCCHGVCFRCFVKSTKKIINAKRGTYYPMNDYGIQ